MSAIENLTERVAKLPPERQQQALDYIEFLEQKSAAPSQAPRESLWGVCAGDGPVPSAEDIAEARREMWGDFGGEVSE